MLLDPAAILRDLDDALADAAKAVKVQGDKYWVEHERAFARLSHAVERFAPPGSFYAKRVAEIREMSGLNSPEANEKLPGLARALRDDIAANRLKSVTELVHAEVFADFLDMAKHLLDQGYKDAAAVIAGSSLEAHLRALSARHGISPDDDEGRPKKADKLNAELHTAGAYASKGDLKQVTAWLDLRNEAAHGHYDTYLPPQVNLMVAGVRDFIGRYSA